MNSFVIKLEQVGKKYQLLSGHRTFVKKIFVPFDKPKEVWALKDVNFEVRRGETVGVIGENGSGKSTLLKIIAGITTPTKGEACVNGRVGSLLELGAGFHQDLTGRENIFLNGSLLGFTKKELLRNYDRIVEFADIGAYINQPIRTYSSGMIVRLGFSVAVNFDPDILLVDEVLAVGDEQFQGKCLEKIGAFKNSNKTIILVSHNLNQISFICQKTAFLDKGQLRYFGKSKMVIDRYLESTRKNYSSNYRRHAKTVKEAQILQVKLLSLENRIRDKFEVGDPLKIRIYYWAKKKIKNPIFGVHIHSIGGYYCHGTTTQMSGEKISQIEGKGYVDYEIKNLSLLGNSGQAGVLNQYYISAFLQCHIENIVREIDYYKNAKTLMVTNTPEQHGIVYLESRWVIN